MWYNVSCHFDESGISFPVFTVSFSHTKNKVVFFSFFWYDEKKIWRRKTTVFVNVFENIAGNVQSGSAGLVPAYGTNTYFKENAYEIRLL